MFQKFINFQNEVIKSDFHCTMVQTGARQSALDIVIKPFQMKHLKTRKPKEKKRWSNHFQIQSQKSTFSNLQGLEALCE